MTAPSLATLALQALADPVSMIDAQGCYVLVNDAWCAVTGWPRDKALGCKPDELLKAPLLSPARTAARNAALRERRAGQVCEPSPAGRWLETTYHPFGESGPGAEWVVMVTRDVTAEREAQAALRSSADELRAVLDAFPGFIAVVDQDLRYVYANTRLGQRLGHAPEALQGRLIREILSDEAYQVNVAEINRLRAGQLSYTLRHHPATATQARLDLEVIRVTAGPRPDGSQLFYAFAFDITALKLTEEALTAARDEAERAHQAKSRFITQASHELRTPLNAILGFAQLLQLDPVLQAQPQQLAQAERIAAGGQHLLELINEILELGRIEAGSLPLDLQPVVLAPLCLECLSLVQPLAARQSLQMALSPLLPEAAVWADRVRLKQVVLNLLGNALKYNRPLGAVGLDLHLQDGGWTISVRDTGLGLDDAQLARLFQPFERLTAPARGIEGTGLGLALSRRFVEAMQGRIGVDSVPGEGSRFWVWLPQAAAADALPAPVAPPAAAPLPSSRRKRRVLYIEDNVVNTLLMQAMLAQLPDVELSCAEHPLEGLRMAQAQAPDLILLDLQLPHMDGLTLFAKLREHPTTGAVPVVAVTADVQPERMRAALTMGFAAYLSKPLDLPTLLRTVAELLPAA